MCTNIKKKKEVMCINSKMKKDIFILLPSPNGVSKNEERGDGHKHKDEKGTSSL